MKAVRVHAYGTPEVMHLEDVPDPAVRPGEVLVRIEAAGVNVVEVFQRSGEIRVPLPFTPGGEGAGRIVALGAGVGGWQLGDRVVSESFRGTYAELATVRPDRIVRVPDGVPFASAAAVMMRGITAHYLAMSTYPIEPGDRCLIHAGAGGVGLLLCQIAKHLGGWVAATTSSAANLARIRDAGVDAAIDYTTQDVVEEVKRLTNGEGVDVVYDSVGKDTFDASLDCLRRRGMMVVCGQASGPIPPFDVQTLNRKGSLYLTRPLFAHHVEDPQELTDRVSELLRWIDEGWLRVDIERSLALTQAAEAHRALEAHRAIEVRETGGKLVLVP